MTGGNIVNMRAVFIVMGILGYSATGYSATIPAATCSYANVSNAISAAALGDTVTVPAGTCTWGSTLNITKGVSLIGAGKANTIITNTAGTIVEIQKTQNSYVRLSGFTFNNSDNQTPIIAVTGPAYRVRIDNIVINKGDAAIGTNWIGRGATGPVYGVVDNSEFYNNSRTYFAMDLRSGDGYWGATAWNEFLGNERSFPGSDRMMIFEDNQFIWNKSLTNPLAQAALYGQYGAKATFRYNTFKGYCAYVDGHGDLGPDQKSYGTIYYELYNNMFVEDNFSCSQGNIVWLRGGQLIAHHNTFTGGAIPFRMSVYYTSDLAEHRVKNSYYWENTWNGNPSQQTMVRVNDSGQTPSGYSSANIKLDQQYFLRAPAPGELFYPYKPFTYPHPLRGEVRVLPAPFLTVK